MIVVVISIGALLVSCGLTAWLLHFFRSRQIVDRPNSRSSHSTPTPRGGGLAIVAVTTAGVLLYATLGIAQLPIASVMILGGVCVAAVGFWDDVRSAPIAVRMAVHLGAAALAVYCLDGVTRVRLGPMFIELGIWGTVLSTIGVVWILNLFNFMDGIDGIAASEAVCVLFGAATIGLAAHASPDTLAPAFLLGSACLGFLVWNWPPASIFMGDVGSGYLGFSIAVLALYVSAHSPVNLYAWTILGGVFLVDATLTLLRRLLRRERVYQAHRTHAYQWLSRRWKSHARVTVGVILVDLLWLIPCAAFAVRFADAAPLICLLAFAPLIACAVLSGAGRRE